MRIEQIWYEKSLLARLGQLLLFPLHLIYWVGWKIYLLVYKLGLKKAVKPHSQIICIGNFATGGNGKTPVTVWIARQLLERGFEVVIGCSGYGSPRAEAASIAPEGALDPREWGDEPAEFRSLLPEVPIIVGRRRVLAAELCASRFPRAVLLMDDGLQHMPLAKDVVIALDRPQASNRLCFPAGPYREPRSDDRADVILPNSEFEVCYSEIRFISTIDGSEVQAARANLLTAIGRPDLLIESLGSKVELGEVIIRPDHDSLTELPLKVNDLPLLVTRKDWVKIRMHPEVSNYQFVLIERHASIQPEEVFMEWLTQKISKIQNVRSVKDHN